MITAIRSDGSRRELPLGSNCTGERFAAIELTSSSDVMGCPKTLEWFLSSVLTRLPAAAPKLMTLSEARMEGYSLEHDHCGPSASGAVIRVGKWDKRVGRVQFIDVRPDPVEA